MNLFLVLFLTISACNIDKQTQFSEAALEDNFITWEGESVKLRNILEMHRGKTILIDVWASWCKDCIRGIPKLKELQDEYPDAVYLFLSLDRNMASWKKGVEKYQLRGEHYFMQSGWNGPFGDFLNLNWIPRYLVVDKSGAIKLYKATKATNKNLKSALQ